MSRAVTRKAHRWRAVPPAFDRWRAVRSTLTFGLCLGAVTAVAGLHYGVFAAIGCYVDAYGTRDPYPRRGPVLGLLCAGFVVTFTAGSLVAGDVWAMTAVLAVVAGGATLFVHTLHLSGPGSYFVVLVSALAAFLPPVGLAETVTRAGCVAIGASVSWLSAMSGRLVRPYAPEERAVSAAFRSVAAFADTARRAAAVPPRGDSSAARRSACTAVHAAWAALEDARGRGTAPAPRRLALFDLMVRLEAVFDTLQNAVERGGDPVPATWAPWLRASAAAVRAGATPGSPLPPSGGSAPAPPNRAGGTPGAPPLSRPARAPRAPRLPPRRSLGAEMRHAVSSASPAPTVALRVALAVAVGTVLGWALPLLHPAWVAVGAAASLQGGPGRQPSQRVGSRFVGTVAGVAITVLVAQVHQPGTGATVAVATVVHGVSRGLPPSALLLRTLLNTPVALLLVDAVLPEPDLAPLAAYRLLDLTLGMCLGMAAALLVRGVPLRRVRAAVSVAVAATGSAVGERLRTGTFHAASAATAWQRTSDLWTMHASVPVEEIRATGTADRLWPSLLAIRRLLCWNLLRDASAPAPDESARVGDFLRALSGAARTDLPGSPGIGSALSRVPRTPRPAHEPELHRRLTALRSALEDAALPPPATEPPRETD
ncbi:FUSC family protein [Streptomyces griseoaurantiacus]|uniref:FUSC family protein n=2 Tax=Streptomyces TaxID=1883 RepID=UPI002ED1FAF5|nr:FUSC family protein [Streptomyces jietaisiensis]